MNKINALNRARLVVSNLMMQFEYGEGDGREDVSLGEDDLEAIRICVVESEKVILPQVVWKNGRPL